MTVRAARNINDLPTIVAPTRLEFQIKDIKFYVPVVTLSTENDKKLLQLLKSGFKRTVRWNKYRSQMTIQSQNKNLNYLIDPTFTKVNKLSQHLLKSTKFFHFQEMMKEIIEILFHIIMYQTSIKKISTCQLMEKVLLTCQ